MGAILCIVEPLALVRAGLDVAVQVSNVHSVLGVDGEVALALLVQTKLEFTIVEVHVVGFGVVDSVGAGA